MSDYADRLEQEYDKVVAERDRLRAVVDAALKFCYASYPTRSASAELIEARTAFEEAVTQLDVSPAMGNPPTAAELNRLSAERAGEHYVTPTMGGTDSAGDDDLTVAVSPADHRGAGGSEPPGAPSETPDTGT